MSRSVVDQIRDELVFGVERFEARRRRGRATAVAMLLVVALVSGAVVRNAHDGGGSKVLVQPDETSTTTPLGPALQPGPLPGLSKLPPAPAGATALAPVWTGTEFLFVGAIDEEGTVAAFSYDVNAGSWRTLAFPPAGIGAGSSAVWTGRELVICCGASSRSDRAAAYDPVSDSWRVLPNSPVHGYTTAVWTGSEVIVVAPDGVASFDPANDHWTRLPAPEELASFNKSVWTGDELVVWPAPGSRTVHGGEVFSPESRKWSTLASPPAGSWPAIPDIAWIAGSLVVIGGLPAATGGSERLVGARYDPATNTWESLGAPLPEPDGCECNLGSQDALSTGTDLLLYTDALASGWSSTGVLMAYDPSNDSWRLVGDTTQTALRPIARAGDRVLLERDDTYYLSRSGWSPAGERAIPLGAVVCSGAQHAWEVTPPSIDESGDGLPPSGYATRIRAERELRDRGAAITNQYGAVSAAVGAENGRAVKQVAEKIEIVDEPIATIVVVLPAASKCPAAPAFDDGIPLTFIVSPNG